MRYKFTGKYLRNTGQLAGDEGQTVFTAVPCACGLCQGGQFVAVDQADAFAGGQRHVLLANLQEVSHGC